MTGLVMLLPHGYGTRTRTFVSSYGTIFTAVYENNMYVCNITTAANFFHVLRGQLKNEFRNLIIMSQKLLRHPLNNHQFQN